MAWTLLLVAVSLLHQGALCVSSAKPEQTLFEGLMVMKKVSRMASLTDFPYFHVRNNSTLAKTRWNAVVSLCHLLDEYDELQGSGYTGNITNTSGTAAVEIDAMNGIIEGVINDTCNWLRAKFRPSESVYVCSSRSAPKFKALCLQMRLHDLVKSASDTLVHRIYRGQLSRGTVEKKWIESKFSGRPEQARIALPVLTTFRAYKCYSNSSITHVVRC